MLKGKPVTPDAGEKEFENLSEKGVQNPENIEISPGMSHKKRVYRPMGGL